MLFQTPLFLAFVAALLAVLLVTPTRRGRQILLLGASYAFYAGWDWRFLSLIWLSTGVDFLVGRILGRTERHRRGWLALSVAVNLGLLGTFKYYDFFAASAASLLARLGTEVHPTTLSVTLPVGISFYTFQTMSYTIDVYRRRIAPEPSLLRFSLFVAFFPQLVAGPIVRAREFLPQLSGPCRPRARDLAPGLFLFSIGLFKKVVLADHLARVADIAFTPDRSPTAGLAAAGILCYTFQIYMDFSGYSDMAVGIGRVLGFRLPRNFRWPYIATSPSDFWRRWHVSLSTWLRDYLYISLGGNRRGRWTTYRNLLLTMLLGGLWHGAGWHFVAWGAWHGAWLGFWRRSGRLPAPLGWALTSLVVLGGWVLFRASDLGHALALFGALGGGGAVPLVLDRPTTVSLAALGLAIVAHTGPGRRLERHVLRTSHSVRAAAAGFLIVAAFVLGPGGTRAFIYFQF